jgi:hypothetical protein
MGEQVSLVPAPTTTTTVSAPTLLSLVHKYFEEDDHEWALTVAFCESSAQPDHETSDAVELRAGSSIFQSFGRKEQKQQEYLTVTSWTQRTTC